MRLPSPAAALPLARTPSLLALLLASGGVFFALLAGVLVARSPAMGAALGAAALFAPIALTNLPLGIALWTTAVFVSILPGVSLAFSAGGLLLAFAWLGTVSAGRAAGVKATLASLGKVGTAVAVLLLWIACSFAWASRPELGRLDMTYWCVNGLLLAIVVTTMVTAARLRLVIGAFIIGALLSIVVGALSGDLLNQAASAIDTATAGRFSAGNDPNELAAGLVPAIALAIGLAVCMRPGPLRLGVMLSVPVLVTGVVMTQSRGGLVAGMAAILTGLVVARGRRLPLFAAISAIVLVAAFALATTPGALERVTETDNGGNGRTELWTMAWRMWQDNPVIGVGLNQFRIESEAYVREPGNLEYVDLIVESPHVVHNTYLQLLAETGVIGLALFLVVVALCLQASWRAASLFRRNRQDDLAALAQAILVAQVGILSAAFFLSTGDFKFWLLLGLGPAAFAVARKSSTTYESGRVAR